MSLNKRFYIILMLATGLFFSAASFNIAAQSNTKTFTVINKTGITIYALYATPHSSNNWGEDILAADVLPNGDELGIVFTRKETSKLWDLRIEDEDGEFIEWENIDLRAISTITLYYKNGNATAVFDENIPDLNGDWIGYFDDGTMSDFTWAITQNGTSFTVENVGKGAKAKSRGTVNGNSIRALDFGTKNGVLSADGTEIRWSDGVVWIKKLGLNGIWDGYYDDGSRSPYSWNIGHIGSTISITDANGGPAKSRGSISGNKITAHDFATKNGVVSADGRSIRWSDGVVWKRRP